MAAVLPAPRHLKAPRLRAALRYACRTAALVWASASALTAVAQAPAPADRVAPAEPDEAKDDAFKWDYSWKNWEGLSFYASQPTRIKASVEAVPILDLQEVELTGSIGGRIEIDGAAFSTGGDLSGFNDGFELRRARVTAKGASILGVPFSYRVDLGYVPGRFTVTQAYVVVPGVRVLGNLQFGQFTPPVGLQTITSSWDIGLMEPAAPLQAMAPASQPGVQATDTYADRRGTWTLGAYAGVGTGGEYGSVSKSFGNIMGRISWLALDQIDEAKPAVNRYLHLGASANVQKAANGQIRYRSRPESHIAPYVIDTGSLDASSAGTLDVELLWTHGPFSAQGELIASRAGTDTYGTLSFAGLYAQASWYLTGESRPYNRSDGAPGRLIPLRNFDFGPDAGWGALEAALRASYTDLNDGGVRGGKLSMLMGSLNWYLRPQLKCMFELGAGRVSGGASEGNFVIGQVRLGLYYY